MRQAIRWMTVLMGLAAGAYAYEGIVLTSYTATADTTRTIRIGPAELVGIVVGTPGGQITVYNSSNTTTTDPRFVIDAATATSHVLNAFLPIGLTYSKPGTGSVTFLYR